VREGHRAHILERAHFGRMEKDERCFLEIRTRTFPPV
jgi:hypothetical protein